MPTQRTVDGAPQRSARRATARRASNRRATARQYKDDVEGRIVEYVKEHPHSTTGAIAKGLNADRGTIAAGRAHIVRASGQDVWPTIIASLADGPLRGRRIEAEVIEGRPPSTVDLPADDGSTCRYCLAGWVQSGRSAAYTFLYHV